MGGAGRRRIQPAAGKGAGAGHFLLGASALTTFIVVFDSAAVVIPLPSIAADLGAGLVAMTFIYAAFILAFAVLLLPGVSLADRYGQRRVLLAGVALFAAGSLACALARSLPWLIGARAVAGAGAALAEPAAFVLLTTLGAAGAQRAAFGAAAAFAPVAGGAITTGLSWRYVFAFDVLVGAAVLAAMSAAVGSGTLRPAASGAGAARRVSSGGAGLAGPSLATAGLGAAVVAIIAGSGWGWRSPAVVILLTAPVALLALAALVRRGRRSDQHAADGPGLLRSTPFVGGNLLRGAGEFASLGVFFALSHLLQARVGLSALAAGALLMSVMAGALLTAPLAERLAGRADARLLIMAGFLLVAAGVFWLARVPAGSGWVPYLAPLVLVGAGFGLQEDTTVGFALAGVPAVRALPARHISYTCHLVGIAVGVAVVSAVMQARLPSAGLTAAVHSALLSCVAVAALGMALAAFLLVRGMVATRTASHTVPASSGPHGARAGGGAVDDRGTVPAPRPASADDDG